MNRILFLIAILAVGVPRANAQDKPADRIVMLNGEDKTGQVTEIGDTYVKFVHSGETLVYTLKKSEINKIQFSSGRVEFVTQVASAAPDANAVQTHHNNIAVLPFSYIGRGGSGDDKLGLKVQSDCFNLLKKNAAQFNIQDPVTTNALLIKNNINSQSIMGFTPVELANILNVEYVVMGMVTVNEKGSTTTGGNYFNAKDKGRRTSGYTAGTSSTTNEFSTSVDIKIYSDQGQNIFAESRESFWQTEDAYQMTLQYLIKRTPLYHK